MKRSLQKTIWDIPVEVECTTCHRPTKVPATSFSGDSGTYICGHGPHEFWISFEAAQAALVVHGEKLDRMRRTPGGSFRVGTDSTLQ